MVALTEKEKFIAKEVAVWGEEYIFSLYDQGYAPTFVPGLGWRFMPVITDNKSALGSREYAYH